MGWACGMFGEKTETDVVSVGTPDGKGQLGRSRCRWEDYIKMIIQEIRWEVVDWNELACDRDKCRAVVNTVMNLWFP